MVADICLSLSRQKEDKVLGTGRVHVMKNRYGMDGMTFNVVMDTNNGHIEFKDKMEQSTEQESSPFSIVNKEKLEDIFANRI